MNTSTTRITLVGLLVVQLVVGYEWAMSGLTKIVRGGFPAGLADELREKSQGAAGWYTGFLDSVVIPNGRRPPMQMEGRSRTTSHSLVRPFLRPSRSE